MRSFIIVLFLAICAPAVLCQSDNPFFYYFFWLTPIASNTSSISETSSNPSPESTSTDVMEPNPYETRDDFLPSDVYYDRDQSSSQSAPVQYETESETDTTAPSTIEEMASESGKKSSDEEARQTFVESEFWKHFMTILTKLEQEEKEERPDKAELKKFNGKKYNPNVEKKSPQVFKESAADTMSFYFGNTASSSSHSQEISSPKINPSLSAISDESSEDDPDFSTQCSEESSYDEGYRSESSNDNSGTNSKDTSTETSGIYLDSESFFVPLAPFPDDYVPTPYIVEKSNEEMTDKKIDDTLPRLTASTISFPSTGETVDNESTKEDKAQESSISEPTIEKSSVSGDKADEWNNQRIAEFQSSASNTKEENFEIISSNDDETMDDVSTKAENVESTKEDEAESTDDKNNNEIENEIPDNDKPMGHISFGQFMKALIKRMVL